MRTLLIYVLLSATASASDVEVRTRTAIAITKAKLAVQVAPPKRSELNELSDAVDVYLDSAKKFKKSVSELKKSTEVAYYSMVKRGYAQPRNWDVEGDDFATKAKSMQHLYDDHRNALPHTHDGRVLDLSGLSNLDLRNIHGMIHDGRMLGRWLPTVCPLDGGPCQMTWEWHLP
jgi:hypothetical protein